MSSKHWPEVMVPYYACSEHVPEDMGCVGSWHFCDTSLGNPISSQDSGRSASSGHCHAFTRGHSAVLGFIGTETTRPWSPGTARPLSSISEDAGH